MLIEVIKSTEAPVVEPKRSAFSAALLAALANLGEDEVLKIKPAEGKSLRGTKTGVGRIAKANGMNTDTWDDGETLFVRINRAS